MYTVYIVYIQYIFIDVICQVKKIKKQQEIIPAVFLFPLRESVRRDRLSTSFLCKAFTFPHSCVKSVFPV